MSQKTKTTRVIRLNTHPRSAELKDASPAEIRAAKRKADMEWQMNLAKVKLNGLKSENLSAKESFQTFHNTAHKSLWNLRRGQSA